MRVGVTARILACALATLLAVLQFPALAGCVEPADSTSSSVQHDPCHEAGLSGIDDGCTHEIGPDPIVAPDALSSIGTPLGTAATALAERAIPRLSSADVPSRRLPPGRAAPVPLFLLHLSLLI